MIRKDQLVNIPFLYLDLISLFTRLLARVGFDNVNAILSAFVLAFMQEVY